MAVVVIVVSICLSLVGTNICSYVYIQMFIILIHLSTHNFCFTDRCRSTDVGNVLSLISHFLVQVL
jgi:hypothetical protein